MTLFEVINAIKTYTAPALKSWRKVFVVGLLGAILFVLKAWLSMPSYQATAIIHPDDEGGSAANPLLALIPTAPTSISPNQRMTEVLESWRIRNLVAADTTNINGKKVAIHDLLLERYPPKPSLQQRLHIGKPFKFPKTPADKIGFATSWLENIATVEENENMFLTVTFIIPKYSDLIEIIGNSYFEQLQWYYKMQKTAKARSSVDYFNRQCDSVRREMEGAISTTARYEDKYKFNVLAQTYVPRETSVMKAEALKQMYAQLVVSREQAVAQLLNDTPVVQVLDPPNQIKPIVSSKVKGAILGFILGSLLMSIYLLRDALKRDGVQLLDTLVQRITAKDSAE